MSIKHAEFQPYGKINGTSITGTYQTVLTLSGDADIFFIFNSCDKELIVSVPGTPDAFYLPPTRSLTFDARTNKKRIKAGTFEVKHAGVAPTTGIFSVTIGR